MIQCITLTSFTSIYVFVIFIDTNNKALLTLINNKLQYLHISFISFF